MQQNINDIVLKFLTIVNYPNDKEKFLKEFEELNRMEALANIYDTLPPETQEKIKATTDPEVFKQLVPEEAYAKELIKVSGMSFAEHISDTLPLLEDSQKEQIKQLLADAQALAGNAQIQPLTQASKKVL